MANTVRILLLSDPLGRYARFLPEMQEEFKRLAADGLFKYEDKHWRPTLEGRICHILAREINPRRASERTTEVMNVRLLRWINNVSREPDVTLPEMEAALDRLVALGLIEPDPMYTKQSAWRLIP